MHGVRPKKPKPPAMLWPPRLNVGLQEWLCERYPDKDRNLLGVVAITIDGLIRDMLRADRGDVKVLEKCVSLPSEKKHRSPVDALRRIQDAVKSGNHDRYAKAIAEAPIDCMALIEQVSRSIVWSKTVPGVTGFPIPAPAVIAPYLPKAIALASRSGAWSGWRRDRTIREIAHWFVKITGQKEKQSSKAGSFLDFLDGLESFYNEHLPAGFQLQFGVQKSSRALTKILGATF